MGPNKLSVITSNEKSTNISQKRKPKEEAKAHFERLWLKHPESFDLNRNAREKLRVERTLALLKKHLPPNHTLAADLGCGEGTFARALTALSCHVHASDISQNALKELKKRGDENIETFQDALPHTKLTDKAYSIVLALDVVADLHAHEQRLFFAELVRLVADQGVVLCSTPLDFNSENALELFADLAQTEFTIEEWAFSYHRLQIRLIDLLDIPHHYSLARRDKTYRQQQSAQKGPLGNAWFAFNHTLLFPLWGALSLLTTPLQNFCKKSRGLALFLEKIARPLLGEAAISHATFLGKTRPLFHPSPSEQPIERKKKRQVWE